MPLQTEHRLYGELDDRLRDARAMTAELLSDVINGTCWRLPSIRSTESAAQIERLMKSDAWTDAVLALIEIELPQWRIRRIAYDEGEWHCALSRQRELPDWLDPSIESSHADLALAMLGAFIEAARVRSESVRTSVPNVPRTTGLIDTSLCCDNFV
jgi:hypothetical protein